MRLILTLIIAVATFISAAAAKFSYKFANTPLSEAIVKISKDHPEMITP